MAWLFKKSKRTPVHSVPVSDRAEAVFTPPIARSDEAFQSATSEGALALDVYVTDSQVVVQSAIAGVRPEDIVIALHNDLLTVRGERHEKYSQEVKQYMVQECYWGAFSRSVVLPVSVQADSATATMQDGVLTITLTRSEPTAVTVRVVT
ncbi:MAG: Hsp20/alpha crystallin family protein [Patescibacteria group bacterium]|jgi:HSP20 family protein